MNFMPTVEKMTSAAEALYDEEEFVDLSVDGVDQWADELSWLVQQPEPVPNSILRIANLWETKADVQFQEAIAKVDTTLKAIERITLVVNDLSSRRNAQLVLPISTSFTPSDELIQSWKENASSYGNREAIMSAKSSEASAEFSRMLKRLIAAFAQEMRYAGARNVVVADQYGDFDANLQLEISERFLLLPQKSTSFFSLLHRDLMSGGEDEIFSGGWGSFVRKSDNRLLLELNRQNTVKRAGFVKAQETRK
jgi:hypothetical protein